MANKEGHLGIPPYTTNPAQLGGQRMKCNLTKGPQGFGLGAVAGTEVQFLQIVTMVPNGAAWKNGNLKVGDILVKVDDKCVLGLSVKDLGGLFGRIAVGASCNIEITRGFDLLMDPDYLLQNYMRNRQNTGMSPYLKGTAPPLIGDRVKCQFTKSGTSVGFKTLIPFDGETEFLQIIKILPNTPADKDGTLRRGDILVSVNNNNILGHPIEAVSSAFQAIPQGSTVSIEVFRCSTNPNATVDAKIIFKGPQIPQVVNKPMQNLTSQMTRMVAATPAQGVPRWYWQDEYSNWVEYGNTNNVGAAKANITSDEIERAYQIQPTSEHKFSSSTGHNYVINFAQMYQKNIQYKTERKIKREIGTAIAAPIKKPVIVVKLNYVDTGIPGWAKMPDTKICELVNLETGSAEYKRVAKFFHDRLAGVRNTCVRISRVQNPTAYKTYENKKEELLKIYGRDVKKVNEMELFHGTNYDIIERICEENLDWRLQGTNVGAIYGSGVYFSSSSNYSSNYCKSSKNEFGMFVCKVLVGSIEQGHKGMLRPTDNPQTNRQYDSTVDNPNNPTIFVKYYDNTFYPAYVVYFTKN